MLFNTQPRRCLVQPSPEQGVDHEVSEVSILDFNWEAARDAQEAISEVLPGLDEMLVALRREGVLDDASLEALRAGALPKVALNISESEMEQIFRLGHNALCIGDVKGAAAAFERLCRLDPLEGRYIYALAATRQISEQFSVAARLYLMSIAFGVGGGEPYVRLGECLMASNETSEAREVLEFAIELAGEGPAQSAARERAQKLIAIISSQAAKD